MDAKGKILKEAIQKMDSLDKKMFELVKASADFENIFTFAFVIGRKQAMEDMTESLMSSLSEAKKSAK